MEKVKDIAFEKRWLDLKRNCDYYFSRVIDYPLCPPEHVYFSLTGRCNLKCKMCSIPNPHNRQEDELTAGEVKRLIDQIVDMKVDHLTFSGGEPLLRNDIFELIAYAVDKKISMVDIISNGLLINEEVAKKLVKSGVTHITVSIDGLEEANDFIRGKGSFRKAAEAIDLINKYRKNNFPSLGINFTIMDCNIGHILPIIDLAKEKQCNIVVFQPMLSDNTDMQKRNRNELWVSKKNIPILKETMEEVINLKKTMQGLTIHVNERILRMVADYFSGQPLGSNLQCYECIVRITVSHNGDLWTCKGIYGNFKTGLLLRSRWLSFKAKNIRQDIKQCQNHCLQSCIHLAELSDVYSEINKFKAVITEGRGDGEYKKKLSALLERYMLLLKKKMAKNSKRAYAKDKDSVLTKFKLEVENLSKIMEELA